MKPAQTVASASLLAAVALLVFAGCAQSPDATTPPKAQKLTRLITSPAPKPGESKDRDLDQYYSRRVYLGSPPFIPHPVKEVSGKVEACLSCHLKGRKVPKYNANAPITPHPTFANCVQCHVRKRVTTLFKGNDWQSVKPPELGNPELPKGPPPIPHTLQLRENCMSCHQEPFGVTEIQTPHPERINCQQCHVPRRKIAPFSRPVR